jgi:hypothetical protein
VDLESVAQVVKIAHGDELLAQCLRLPLSHFGDRKARNEVAFLDDAIGRVGVAVSDERDEKTDRLDARLA